MAIELSEMFWTFFITSIAGFILAVTKMCYKSKCTQIDLCCIKISRNIDAEVKEDIELGNKEEENKSSK
jgi:hypothetical protein